MITIFSAIRWLHHTLLCLLGRWFRTWHRKLCIRKNDCMGLLKFWDYNGGPKKKKMRILTKKGHKGYKWREDFKSGLRIRIKKHLTPFLAKKRSKTGKIPFSTDFCRNIPLSFRTGLWCRPLASHSASAGLFCHSLTCIPWYDLVFSVCRLLLFHSAHSALVMWLVGTGWVDLSISICSMIIFYQISCKEYVLFTSHKDCRMSKSR